MCDDLACSLGLALYVWLCLLQEPQQIAAVQTHRGAVCQIKSVDIFLWLFFFFWLIKHDFIETIFANPSSISQTICVSRNSFFVDQTLVSA